MIIELEIRFLKALVELIDAKAAAYTEDNWHVASQRLSAVSVSLLDLVAYLRTTQ